MPYIPDVCTVKQNNNCIRMNYTYTFNLKFVSLTIAREENYGENSPG